MAAPRNIDTRGLILDTTVQLLQDSSFDAISLAKIAEAAGISKGTLYYHYNSKDDILFDINDRYLSSLERDLRTWLADGSKDTSLPRLLRYILERGSAKTFGNLRLYLIGAGMAGRDSFNERYVELYERFHTLLTESIAQRAPEADASYITWLLLTAMDGALIQQHIGNDAFDVAAFITKTARLATDALGGHMPE